MFANISIFFANDIYNKLLLYSFLLILKRFLQILKATRKVFSLMCAHNFYAYFFDLLNRG